MAYYVKGGARGGVLAASKERGSVEKRPGLLGKERNHSPKSFGKRGERPKSHAEEGGEEEPFHLEIKSVGKKKKKKTRVETRGGRKKTGPLHRRKESGYLMKKKLMHSLSASRKIKKIGKTVIEKKRAEHSIWKGGARSA